MRSLRSSWTKVWFAWLLDATSALHFRTGSPGVHKETDKQAPSGKVVVEIYYETLCPTCQYFIRTSLKQLLYDPEVRALVDLRLFPFGNGAASLLSDGTYVFQCQHGFEECVGNKIHACAAKLFSDQPERYLQLFTCMAENSQATIGDGANVCAQHFGMDSDKLNLYLKSIDVKEAMLNAAKKASALEPPRKYVPWVTINGQHSERAERGELMSELCSAIKLAGGQPRSCDVILTSESHIPDATLAPCFAGVNASVDAGSYFAALPFQFSYSGTT